MRRIRLTLAYDGTAYAGWQVQPNVPTIQGTLGAVLCRIEGGPVRVTGAGRTDAGVHAHAQEAHFDTEKPHSDVTWVRALNAQLPRDIVVLAAREVEPEFHARHSAGAKHYRYRILNRPVPCPFRRAMAWYVPIPLDRDAMHEAARLLVGEHDFSGFRASGCAARSAVRRLDRLEVSRQGDEVVLDVVGSGFLKQMVRNIAGTLVEVGRGVRPPAWVGEVLRARDRTRAGETAPAWGLALVSVSYPAPFG